MRPPAACVFEVDKHGSLELSDDGREVIDEALSLAASPEARDAFEERIAEVRARPELQPPLEAAERKAFLVQIAWRRQLIAHQLAIEQRLSGG